MSVDGGVCYDYTNVEHHFLLRVPAALRFCSTQVLGQCNRALRGKVC